MAEDGYSKSAIKHIRTDLKACNAIDEDLISKNPARKLAMPNIPKKPCERFLSVEEVQALLSAAWAREHLVLRTSEMELLRADSKLRTNSFFRLRRLVVDGQRVLDIQDLGDSEKVLKNRALLGENARVLLKRGRPDGGRLGRLAREISNRASQRSSRDDE